MQGVIKWIGCVDDRPEPLAGLELVILSLRIKLLEIMYLICLKDYFRSDY